ADGPSGPRSGPRVRANCGPPRTAWVSGSEQFADIKNRCLRHPVRGRANAAKPSSIEPRVPDRARTPRFLGYSPPDTPRRRTTPVGEVAVSVLDLRRRLCGFASNPGASARVVFEVWGLLERTHPELCAGLPRHGLRTHGGGNPLRQRAG